MKSVADIFRSYGVLDTQGRHVNGTDKMTNHFYGDAYERIVSDLSIGLVSGRHKVKLMMEIGVADGSSLLAWSEVFPNAQCVGMDIHHSDRAHGERIEFHLGNALLQNDCECVAAGRLFDFICEDGPHQPGSSLLTLLYLWPHVRPGGIYVVEEFYNIGSLRNNVRQLYPHAEVVDTDGPFGNTESLVVFRKPL